MTRSDETREPVAVMIERLLSGPARPGQAFTMPGCNYDALYRLARRIRAFFDTHENDSAPVCIGSDDRTVMAAAMLASLAGGPQLLVPRSLSPDALLDLRERTGFTLVIGHPDHGIPGGVTVIDPQALTDEVETLASEDGAEPDRPWIHLFTGGSGAAPRQWTKTPRNLLGEVDALIDRFEVGSGDRFLSTIPALNTYGLIFSLLLPLAASARVVRATPSLPDAIRQQAADASPTLLVSVPDHLRALKDAPLERGALRLAFSSVDPLAGADDTASSGATGVNLVEVYGSTETGGIATRCRGTGEDGFRPYPCIQWRVAGNSLDIRSPFLSRELPVRSSGWVAATDRVKAHGNDGFVVTGPAEPAIEAGPSRAAPKKDNQLVIDKNTAGGQIKFEPAGLKVPLDETRTIQEIGAEHGIDIRADCGGAGVCGKCRVVVHPGENVSSLTDAELDVLTPAQVAEGSRLACQARVVGSATVTIPDTLAESAETRGKTGITGTYPVDATMRRLTVDGCRPGPKTDNTPESLVDWLAAQVGDPSAAVADVASLRRLAGYRDSLKTFTLVVHEETGIRRIIEGRQPASLGFAVDLGTTSLAGYLCDLKTGQLLAADACVNPQRRFGEDVISRISRINEKDGALNQFQRLAAEGINLLMARCLEQVGATREAVDEVAVCGNTTMEQVFGGLHPYGLGVFPYFPLTLTPPAFSAGDLGLETDPAVPVYLMPVASGFIGGDTMAAILADRPHEREEISLIVDIGTNGEVVLGNREGLWTTSCATGPALEGAQISCGMRAVSGAIHRVWPDETNDRVAYEVLGNEGHNRPMGICGSGIIDAIASLRQIGAILPNGRLDEENPRVVSDDNGVGQYYTLAENDQTATGSRVSVTLKDVRQIQLAKGALVTGIEFLMRKAGIEKIDRTVLTGAFGARFNWKNALAIGMLPPAVARSRVVARDNLAGVGVVMALLDKKMRSEVRSLVGRIRTLELASEPDFAMAFAMATGFPEIQK
jgi:uncharacterized 2Fe-2S/4Fe-4S cluster protein (DUF4445 family)